MKKPTSLPAVFVMRAARKAKGLTLVQVSELTGVEIGNLSRIERCRQLPKPRSAETLAQLYGVTLDAIYRPILDALSEKKDDA